MPETAGYGAVVNALHFQKNDLCKMNSEKGKGLHMVGPNRSAGLHKEHLMKESILNRRQFLQSTTRLGVAFVATSALTYPTRSVQTDDGTYILIEGGLDIFRMPDVQEWLGAGLGALWVAGQFLNTFASNLQFNDLPAILKTKYQLAGGESKGLPAAEAIWKSIPLEVRAGGPDALWSFHKGKDWSHVIPKSWGGPTTPENGIWWSSEKNKSLGANQMSPADIADAKSILRSEAIRATVGQTLKGMVKGGALAVVVGGVLASLNYGLEYAEGELTWLGMVQKIVQSTVVAGASAALITGMIVGLSLLFPFAIPVLLPVIFALQMVSIIFLGPLLLDLAKDWWEVLNGQNLLDASTTILQKAAKVLEDVSKTVHNSYTKAKNSTWRGLSMWANWLARLVGLDRAMRMARNNLRQLGLDTWFNWLAYQSQWMTEQTSLISSSIAWWGYNSAIAVSRAAMGNSIATVVTTQFQNAISTTDGLLRSIEPYGSSAHRNVSQGLLALQPHQRWLQ